MNPEFVYFWAVYVYCQGRTSVPHLFALAEIYGGLRGGGKVRRLATQNQPAQLRVWLRDP